MNWEKLADGAEVLRFWKTVPPEDKEPQIVVLRLSSVRYAELKNDGKGFINHHKVFDKEVRSMTMMSPSAEVAKMVAQSPEAGPQLVVVIHRLDCRAVGAATVESIMAKAA